LQTLVEQEQEPAPYSYGTDNAMAFTCVSGCDYAAATKPEEQRRSIL
jgi:hypothetical protein